MHLATTFSFPQSTACHWPFFPSLSRAEYNFFKMIAGSIPLLVTLAVAVVAVQDAPMQTQNPSGAMWKATVEPANGFEIRGVVVIQSNPDSHGVNVLMNLDGLPGNRPDYRALNLVLTASAAL